MTEPLITPAATTMAAATATMPLLTVFGVNLGLRPDVLVAGFAGALVAIVLLDSVPAVIDTWMQMVQGTLRRMMVVLASALMAGYITPLVLLLATIPAPLLLAAAFVTGAGAQKILAAMIERLTPTAKPEPLPVAKPDLEA